MGQMITLDDFNYAAHQDYVGPDGLPRGKGLVGSKRGYRSAHVVDFPLPLIPDGDIPDRIKQQSVDLNSLYHLRLVGDAGKPIPSRDQDGAPYCWAHSGVSAMLLARAAAGQPYVDLSPFATACMVMNFRQVGGNGDEGLDFDATHGIPTSQFWPQQSMSRSHDNPQTWENAKLHRAQKWYALDTSDRTTLKRQMATCSLLNIPMVGDYNRWSHSVAIAWVYSWNPFGQVIWNSWGDSWSDNGMGKLDGEGWLPDDCWALVSETASEH